MTETPTPTIRPVRYAVTCLPDNHELARWMTVFVDLAGNGSWRVTDGFTPPKIYNADGAIDRTARFDDVETALTAAGHVASRLRFNGCSVAEILDTLDSEPDAGE